MGKDVKKILISLCLIGLVGCVTTYKEPQYHRVEKTRTYNYKYDYIWSKIIEWLGKSGTPIKNMDKNGGFISSESRLNAPAQYMDCGDGGSQTDKSATINIVVAEKDGKITVTINTFYDCHLRYMGWDTGADKRINCNSTGVLEQDIFDYIEKETGNTNKLITK